jgi:hypothetical protein
MQARQALLDSQKITDLESIQSQIVYYWQQKGALPSELTELNDSISNYGVPTDPQNGQAYDYVVNNTHTFQLCATFNSDSNNQPQPTDGYSVPVPASMPAVYSATGRDIGNNWQHGPGKVCFLRTIDPAFYPVTKNPTN